MGLAVNSAARADAPPHHAGEELVWITLPHSARNKTLARDTTQTRNTAHYRLTFPRISFYGQQHHRTPTTSRSYVVPVPDGSTDPTSIRHGICRVGNADRGSSIEGCGGPQEYQTPGPGIPHPRSQEWKSPGFTHLITKAFVVAKIRWTSAFTDAGRPGGLAGWIHGPFAKCSRYCPGAAATGR